MESSEPAAFDYDAFIAELEVLITQARDFAPGVAYLHRPEFLRWRHRAIDLLHRIRQQRYSVSCDLENRDFRAMWRGANAVDQQHAFDRDMQATLIEMEHLVDMHRKYGDPKGRSTVSSAVAGTDAPGQLSAEVNTRELVWAPERAHADAGASQQQTSPTPFEWPDKRANLQWLVKNVPLSTWGAIIGILVAVFLAGIAAGRSGLADRVEVWISPPQSK